MKNRRNKGFTLLEVVIALAVVAIAMGAVLRALGLAADASYSTKSRLLATWVAQNRLAERRAMGEWPSAGESEGTETQGGAKFIWKEKIKDTPNKAFRRIEIRIYEGGDKNHEIANLSGYLLNEKSATP